MADSQKKTPIFVTGGAGFIGSHLIRHLLDVGYSVLCLDKLTYSGNKTNLGPALADERLTFVEGDVRDRQLLEQLFHENCPAAVIHLAAETHVDRSIDGPRLFLESNVVGTFALLEETLLHWNRIANESKKPFRYLQVSTDEVFGSLGMSSPQSVEQSPYHPRSPYSATKAAADHLVRSWGATYGLPILVSHCSNNYGPSQYPEKLIPVVIKCCLEGKQIPLYGSGENIRDWLHVDDHCRALMAVLERGSPGQSYCVGADHELRNIDLIHQICTLLDELAPSPTREPYAHRIAHVRDRPGHDKRYSLNSTKIREELGWQPQVTFAEGLESTVRWYLDHKDWWAEMAGSFPAISSQL